MIITGILCVSDNYHGDFVGISSGYYGNLMIIMGISSGYCGNLMIIMVILWEYDDYHRDIVGI